MTCETSAPNVSAAGLGGTAYRLAITLDSRLIVICDIFDVAEG
jgi:hypothetical protein